MKCKPYGKITVEIRTQLKTVKITSNIFAVYSTNHLHGCQTSNAPFKKSSATVT